MDMDMTQAPEPSNDSPSLAPPAGRIPTPIQPSFMTQVRGNSWAETPDAEAHHHPNGVNNMGHQPTPFAPPPDQTVPRTVGADEWNAVRNRRLPSPISEGEDAQWDDVRAHFLDHLDEVDADLRAAGLPSLGREGNGELN